MLTNAELLASSTVANSTMNRGRGLSGVNSYARELRLDIVAFLEARARERGQAVWYDACCGEGRALVEAGERFARRGWTREVQIIGADLVDLFAPNDCPHVRLMASDVVAYVPEQPVDLVTCVHGLHYLGDKLGFLERAYERLTPGGLLLAHLDPSNVWDAEGDRPLWPRLVRGIRAAGVAISLRSHVLSLMRGERPLNFGVTYRGATVSTRPNYAGITVIDSWYHAGG
ncbi:MAG: class I SAM-dependent methyltransferase [Armatimonadetes bacterium]|nr:class I SAM-dependent methyltransferase [Armatimonadota bacterium]